MNLKRIQKPLIFLLLLSVIFLVLGFRVQHPKNGLSNALGSAESSLVIVRQTEEIKPGDKVVAAAQVGESPVLGIVATVSEDSIELHVENGIARTTQDKVSGKLLIVIPFVGYIFNAIGL